MSEFLRGEDPLKRLKTSYGWNICLGVAVSITAVILAATALEAYAWAVFGGDCCFKHDDNINTNCTEMTMEKTKLYNVEFQHRIGEFTLIGCAISIESARRVISDFLDGHEYTAPYWRESHYPDYIKVDVGSHTEFFRIKEIL